MNAYTLISELYRLLGELDEQTLRQAESMTLAPELKEIIGALAHAKGRGFPSPPISVAVSPPPDVAIVDDVVTVSIQSPLFFLRDRKEIPNRKLLELFHRSGLKVRMRPKEGRESFIRKAEKRLSELNSQDRNRVIESVRRLLGTDELAGWMNVIHPGDKRK